MKIGFGIVGCGMIARVHAQAIAAAEGGRLIGVASRSRERGAAFAAEFGAVFVADSAEALADHPEVDVVCVTTPSGAHLEPALAAARAGKHVLVEKPIEVSVERADRMIRACTEAGVMLGAVFQARFGPGAQRVKALIDSGRLGRLTLCDAVVKWHRDQAYYDRGDWRGTLRLDGGGALMNQAIHAVDLLQWLAGMPTQVFAFNGTLAHERIEVEDTAVAVLKYASGALGVIEATTAAWPGFARRIEISGEHGTVALEDDRISCWRINPELPEDERIRSEFGGRSALRSGHGSPAIGSEGHRRQIQALIDAIRNGTTPPVDGAQARNAVAVVEAIYAAGASDGGVRL